MFKRLFKNMKNAVTINHRGLMQQYLGSAMTALQLGSVTNEEFLVLNTIAFMFLNDPFTGRKRALAYILEYEREHPM